MTEGVPDEDLSPAEERLLRLLLLLQAETRRLDASLTDAVMRRARWQYAARGVARAIGTLAGAIVDGLGLVLRVGSGPTRR